MPDLLLVPVLVVYLAVLVALFAYALNFLYLTWGAVRLPPGDPAVEPPEAWPHVTVQLPIYNEVYVAERLIEAVARLDYPGDALEIQVLDDSTDETVALVSALVAGWRARGLEIRHLHRDHRTAFKAGALAAGLTAAHGTLIAIFDADFIPPPDFLRRSVPVLAADPGLAFVQARWGHANRHDSLLTSLQALSIDGHFAIEQRARSGRGLWFNFNGTAGIWRRAALVDAGGWRDDTLTEDLDISYRAFLRGWRAAYLDRLEVPAELPVSINAYRRQQHRWARGSFECARMLLPRVWRSGAPRPVKAEATLHLLGYLIHPLLLLLCLLYPFVLFAAVRHPLVLTTAAWIAVGNVVVPIPGILMASGQHRLGRDWVRAIPRIAMLGVLGVGMMVNTARAGCQSLRSAPGTFERTPKFGTRRSTADRRGPRYQVAIDGIVGLELALAGLDCVTAWMAVRLGAWAIAVYASVFAIGLFYVVGSTVGQTVAAALATRRAALATTAEPRRGGRPEPLRAGLVEPVGTVAAPGGRSRGA